MSSQNFNPCKQVQNKCKTVLEAPAQNANRSVSTKPNSNNDELDTMAPRFTLLWKDCSYCSFVS